MTSWTDYQDDISDAISDSMDADWSASVGAKAVVAWLNEHKPLSAAPAPEGRAVGVASAGGVHFAVVDHRIVGEAHDTYAEAEAAALATREEVPATDAHPCYSEHQPGCNCVLPEQKAAPVPSFLERMAAREEAPAEAGELIDHLEAYRPHLAGDGVPSLYVSMTLPQLDAVLAALRAQPQAREDAQPLAWRLLAQQQPQPGHKIVTLHDDGSGAALLFVYDGGVIDSDGDDYTKIGSPQTWWAYLPDGFEFWCEGTSEDPVALPAHRIPDHPAPDALRVITPELAAEFANIDGPWTRGQMEMEEVWSRLIDAQLAALQAEQKGGA